MLEFDFIKVFMSNIDTLLVAGIVTALVIANIVNQLIVNPIIFYIDKSLSKLWSFTGMSRQKNTAARIESACFKKSSVAPSKE